MGIVQAKASTLSSLGQTVIYAAIFALSYCYLVKALGWTATDTLHSSCHCAGESEYTYSHLDTYLQPPETYLRPPDTYLQPPDTYLQPPETYLRLPDTYLRQPDTYLVPPDTYL